MRIHQKKRIILFNKPSNNALTRQLSKDACVDTPYKTLYAKQYANTMLPRKTNYQIHFFHLSIKANVKNNAFYFTCTFYCDSLLLKLMTVIFSFLQEQTVLKYQFFFSSRSRHIQYNTHCRCGLSGFEINRLSLKFLTLFLVGGDFYTFIVT